MTLMVPYFSIRAAARGRRRSANEADSSGPPVPSHLQSIAMPLQRLLQCVLTGHDEFSAFCKQQFLSLVQHVFI